MASGSRIAQILIDTGILSKNLNEAYQAQSEETGKSLVDILLDEDVCTEDDITKTVSLQLGFPLVSLNVIRIPGYVAKMLPREHAEKITAIPVTSKKEGDKDVLYVAFLDPTDEEAVEQVERLTKKPIKPVISPRSQILNAIDRYLVPVRGRKPKRRRTTDTMMAASTEYSKVQENEAVVAQNEPEVDVEVVDQIPAHGSVAQEVAPEAQPEVQPEEVVSNVDTDVPVEPVAVDPTTYSGSSSSSIDTVEAAADDDLGGFDIDMGFNESSLDFDEPAKEEAPVEISEEKKREADDFLNIDIHSMGADDAQIREKQKDVESAKQDHAIGVDVDFELNDEKEEPKPAANLNESGSSDDWMDDDFDLVFGEDGDKAEKKDSPSESDDDFDDFDFDIPSAPEFDGGATGSFESIKENESSSEIDLDSFDVSESSTDIETIPPDNEASSVPGLTDQNDDWSLNIDDLFDMNSEDSEGTVEAKIDEKAETIEEPAVIPEPKELFEDTEEETPTKEELPSNDFANFEDDFNFDTDDDVIGESPAADTDLNFDEVVSELDEMLENTKKKVTDEDLNNSSIKLPPELIKQLAGVSEEDDMSDEDVQFIYDFLNGKASMDTDGNPKLQKLNTVVLAMLKTMMEKGLLDEPDFLENFFEKELQNK